MARSEVEPGYLDWREGGVAGARGEDHGSLAKGRLAHRAVGGSEFEQVETVEDLTPSCNPTEHTLELNVQHGTPLFQAFGAPRPNGRRHCGRSPSTTLNKHLLSLLKDLKKVDSVSKALQGASVTLLDVRVWFDGLISDLVLTSCTAPTLSRGAYVSSEGAPG
ncbi:hypothetical protein GQ600_25150 [Phytophthora cactorum]|nr:hypothetical protein GQ600_25150 [Phytophthora cactorum]